VVDLVRRQPSTALQFLKKLLDRRKLPSETVKRVTKLSGRQQIMFANRIN
jgi:hypothetical protein